LSIVGEDPGIGATSHFTKASTKVGNPPRADFRRGYQASDFIPLGVLSTEQDFNFLLSFSFVPALKPAIHEKRLGFSIPGWVYIMTNRPDGTLYVGVITRFSLRSNAV